MIRGIWSLARLDLLLWLRAPHMVAAALLPPAAMVLLVAALTLSVGKQPVALVVASHDVNARAMAQIIEQDQEAYALRRTTLSEAARLLRDQEVAAVIVIPPHFGLAVRAHDATLDLTLNNVDIDFADDIRRAVARSAAEFDAPQLGIQGELGGAGQGFSLPNPYRVSIAEHDQRRTTVSFLSYQLVPALMLLILSVGLMGTALLRAADVERGSARQLLLSPLPPPALVAGRLLGGMSAAFAALAPAILLAALFGAFSPPLSHWPALSALFLTTALAASGLGAALGVIIRRAQTVAMASAVIATYLFFLGGGFTTIAFLPAWLQALSDGDPLRYAIDGLRQCLFYPDLHGIGTDLAALAVTTLLALLCGAAAVRHSWSKA